jgi:dihydrofolate reductase
MGFMLYRLLLLAFVVILVFSFPAAGSYARLGSIFADVYTAFAPLYKLHDSYANYLFTGSEVIVPSGLGEACEELPQHLGKLHMGFIVQSNSQRVEVLDNLVDLQGSVASFCATYQEQIAAIAASEENDFILFSQAADEGLFAGIKELRTLLDDLLNLTLENLKEVRDQWMFNAAFVIRTLIDQDKIEQIEVSVGRILLGSEETPFPPEDLPGEVLQGIRSLVSFSGRELTPQEQEEVVTLAYAIYAFLVEEDSPN